MLHVGASKVPYVLTADSGHGHEGSEGQSKYAEALKHIHTSHK